MLSRFDEFLFRGALWFLEYHNVLLYADKRILSGVKIQELGLCSSFSQQRHYSEVYEKLVPTRQRPGAKKNFRLLLPSMDARPNPLGSCDIISLAGSTDYGCPEYGLFSTYLKFVLLIGQVSGIFSSIFSRHFIPVPPFVASP